MFYLVFLSMLNNVQFLAYVYAKAVMNVVYKYAIVFTENEEVKERLFATINALVNGYLVNQDALDSVHQYAVSVYQAKDDNFANARVIRNLFEKLVSNQANRVEILSSPSIDELSLIKDEDIKF
jgi:hypothetical protein